MKTGLYPVVTLLSEDYNYLKRFVCTGVSVRQMYERNTILFLVDGEKDLVCQGCLTSDRRLDISILIKSSVQTLVDVYEFEKGPAEQAKLVIEHLLRKEESTEKALLPLKDSV